MSLLRVVKMNGDVLYKNYDKSIKQETFKYKDAYSGDWKDAIAFEMEQDIPCNAECDKELNNLFTSQFDQVYLKLSGENEFGEVVLKNKVIARIPGCVMNELGVTKVLENLEALTKEYKV